MQIKTFYFNPFRECTYVIAAEGGHECLVIDPGCFEKKEEERLLGYLKSQELEVTAILITHAHPDHVCGQEVVQAAYPKAQLVDWTAGETEHELAGLRFRILLTPGHKEDCVCFYFESERILFTGDTLFNQGVGRTDLPGGDWSELQASLKRLGTLPKETVVYPGHGYSTTLGAEIQYRND